MTPNPYYPDLTPLLQAQQEAERCELRSMTLILTAFLAFMLFTCLLTK